MAIPATLRNFLDQRGIDYQVMHHDHTSCSAQTAQAAHIPGDRLAKAVVLGDDQGYLMAVLPASRRLHLGWVHKSLSRNLGLATEREVCELFSDCEPGAVPACGTPYGLEMIVDDTLAELPEVYFEAGDHEDLIRMSRAQYRMLTGDAAFGHYSQHI